MANMYSYDRYTQVTTVTPFTPTKDNWFISASNSRESNYFPNLSSYNNWAKTCCSDSYNSIRSGSHGSYDIRFNKF